jgi:hypothetical protein
MRVKGRGKIGGWHRFPFIIPATCVTSTDARKSHSDPQIIAVAMLKARSETFFFLLALCRT